MEHSIFAPSNMPVLVECHGSLMMTAGMVDEDSESAREGTAVHWVAANLFANNNVNVGDVAPNGVVITEEMIDGAETYVDTVIGDLPPGAIPSIEERVHMPQINEDCWGTLDARWYDNFTRTLYLWDLKFGHRSVLAEDNFQLAAYLVGIMNKEFEGWMTWVDWPVKIVARIVAPRCYDGNGLVREWRLTSTDLRSYINTMAHACNEAMKPGVLVRSGPYCRDCLARHNCPAARESAARALDYSTAAVPQTLSAIGLEYERRMLEEAADRIKTRKEALDAEATARIQKGEVIPGLALRPTMSNRKWLVPKEELFQIGDFIGLELRDEVKPVGPVKADALCKKNGFDVSVISDYYGTVPTGVRLVADDGTLARKIFGKGEF